MCPAAFSVSYDRVPSSGCLGTHCPGVPMPSEPK